jgi:hypothetical protein
MKHAPRCSNASQHAPAELRAKGLSQINAATGGPGAARPAGYGHVDDALTRTGTVRGQRRALPTARTFAHMPTALDQRKRTLQI